VFWVCEIQKQYCKCIRRRQTAYLTVPGTTCMYVE